MSTLKVDFIKNRVGTGAVELSEGATIPTGKNLTVGGNLTVQGTTTTISTTNTVISDKIIELANGTSGTPSGDAGIVVERGSSDNAGVIWDESTDKWKFATGSFTGASTGDLTLTNVGIVAGVSSFSSVTSTGAVTADTTLSVASDTTIGITTATATLFADVSLQQVQLGFSGDLPGGNGTAQEDTRCRLAVIASGEGYNVGPRLTMLLGADSGSGTIGNTLTDDNNKEARIGLVHYSNKERPTNLLYYQCTSTQSRIQFGSGTSSCNAPTEWSFTVADNITRQDSSNTAIRLRGEGGGVTTGGSSSRFELYGGISEELAGNFATNLGATPTFDVSQSTCHCGIADANITQISVTGVDSVNNRVTTLQLYLSCGAARTIAGSISINGASAQDLRWSGSKAGGGATTSITTTDFISIVTIIIVHDAGTFRAFGFATHSH